MHRSGQQQNDVAIAHLAQLLRKEIAATQAYTEAIEAVESSAQVREVLETCLESHQDRSELLVRSIQVLGGEPPTDAGLLGSFASIVEAGSARVGDKAAIRTLEQGESLELADYETHIDELDGSVRRLVEFTLMPEQQRTRFMMKGLKESSQLH